MNDVTNGNLVVATTTTDSNGKYAFNNVQKGIYKDETTGNYTADGYKQYYIEFKYNGVTYKSTDGYKNKANLDILWVFD